MKHIKPVQLILLMFIALMIFQSCSNGEATQSLSAGLTPEEQAKEEQFMLIDETAPPITTLTPAEREQKVNEHESRVMAEHYAIMAHIAQPGAPIHVTRTFEKDLLRNYLIHGFLPMLSHQVTFREYNEKYEIEFIRQVSDSRAYSVQKVMDGYFYAFWDSANEDFYHKGGWLYNTAYIQKTLDRQAFSSVKVGTDCADVEKIDPAVSAWLDASMRYDDAPGFTPKLILKDGLLVMDFEKKEQGYAVQRIDFYEDFKIRVPFEIEEVIYDYSILPQDYPE